jgi:hypothetical protein
MSVTWRHWRRVTTRPPIDAILQGATPHDVLALCAHAVAAVVPNCCEAHQRSSMRVLCDCITTLEEEEDVAEADGDDGAHTSVY